MTVGEFLDACKSSPAFTLSIYDVGIDDTVFEGMFIDAPPDLMEITVQGVSVLDEGGYPGVCVSIDRSGAWIERLRQREREVCKRYNSIRPAGCRSLCPLTALHMLYEDMSCDDAVQKNPRLAEYLLGMS